MICLPLNKKETKTVHMKRVIKTILNVKDAIVEDVYIREDGARAGCLIIQCRPCAAKKNRCGKCNRKGKRYDKGRSETRHWRALKFATTKVYIKALVPRIQCPDHGVTVAHVPWARHNSWFTYGFEDTVAWMALHCTRSAASEMMDIAWNTVGPVVDRVYNDVKETASSPFDNLRCIGIDETSYKKGYKYITVVVNHQTGALIWAAKGHGKTILEQFFKLLTPEQRAGIEFVTADGARWITDCITKYCPKAERCIDPFHVVSWATDALDEVRRTVWREAKQAEGKPQKGKRGRPKKGTPPKKKSMAEAAKDSRYALLKNPESLTDKQTAKIEMIALTDKRLYRAYLLKEKLRLLLKFPLAEATKELDAWIKWARHCRIPQFVELQRKIKRHFDAILASVKHNLSNARVEAINNKIKVTIRMGYGFRNIDNLIALLMLRCSNIKLTLPAQG